MEFKVENTQVFGLERAIKASGNPMRTVLNDTEELGLKDLKRGSALGSVPAGTGHDNFLNGVIVQFDVTAPLYWWKQAQRYHFLDYVSSQSTMHRLAKFDIGEQVVEETDPAIVSRYRELVQQYNSLPEDTDESEKKKLWRTLVASLPCGFCLGATMTTNYRQLKTIYYQRKDHKLSEWHVFCKWIESLPMFYELILKNGNKQEENKNS